MPPPSPIIRQKNSPGIDVDVLLKVVESEVKILLSNKLKKISNTERQIYEELQKELSNTQKTLELKEKILRTFNQNRNVNSPTNDRNILYRGCNPVQCVLMTRCSYRNSAS